MNSIQFNKYFIDDPTDQGSHCVLNWECADEGGSSGTLGAFSFTRRCFNIM